MYALLSKASQSSISQTDFGKQYDDALNTMSASKLDYQLLSEQLNPTKAQVSFQITYHTALVGDIQRTIIANLVLEQGQWRIQWDSNLDPARTDRQRSFGDGLPNPFARQHLRSEWRSNCPAIGRVCDRRDSLSIGQGRRNGGCGIGQTDGDPELRYYS